MIRATELSELRVVSPNSGRAKSPGRIPELDGVRGLAIAMVLLYHYGSVSPQGGWLHYAFLPTQLMWSGVDLFFVLSGLLIGGILIDHRESANYYSVFYARRIHRIFPIYYVMVALLFLGESLFPASVLFRGNMPWWTFPLYAQNLLGDFTQAPLWIGVSWSLAVEEQFYLIFPFVVRIFSRKALIHTMVGLVIGAPVLRVALVLYGWGFEQIHPLLACRADDLAFGVLVAVVMRSEEARYWVSKRSKGLYFLLGALFILFPSLLKWRSFGYGGTVGYSIIGLAYCLFILLLLVAPLPFVKKALTARWLRWLGTVSYCVYLIHQPVRIGLFRLFERDQISGPESAFVTVLSLIVTLGLAQLSWMLIERRIIERAHLRYRYIQNSESVPVNRQLPDLLHQ